MRPAVLKKKTESSYHKEYYGKIVIEVKDS